MMELTVALLRTAALVLCLLLNVEAFMWEENQVTVSKISDSVKSICFIVIVNL